ncbi:hypothetical protein D3C78_589080 [compost metagenome]
MSMANLDRAQAISARASSEACGNKTAVLPCGAALYIGFFFDGFGRNLEQDLREDRLSNVGRLFMAHPDDDLAASASPFERRKRFYISGLGADFDPSLGSGAAVIGSGLKGAVSKAQDNLSELPESTATDAGVEASKDILTGKNWWERLLNNLKPGKLLGGAITAAGTASVESVAVVRDHPRTAELFKTGVDTRMEAAWERFQRRVEEISASSEVPLKRIAVSVYGFDFGATLARAFCHKLFDECEPGSNRYQGVELDIVFVGLFDAVDRSMASSIVLDYLLPLVNRVEDGECLPSQVKAALHLVAAHECRGIRRARLIGTGPLTPRWEERLVPGISEDVGGGLRREDAPHSRELHLAGLHEMYRAAYRAGVPFPQMETLQQQDKFVASFFTLSDHINGISALDASTRYLARAGAGTPSAEHFLAHRRLYIRWLRLLWELYRGQSQAFAEKEARLERPLLGSQSRLARLMGQGTESMAQAEHRDRALRQVRADQAALLNGLGWLEAVQREAEILRIGGNSPDVQALLDEWFVTDAPGPGFDIENLLEFFLNDRHMISQIPPAHTHHKYFIVRGFDNPDRSKTRGVAPDPLAQVTKNTAPIPR